MQNRIDQGPVVLMLEAVGLKVMAKSPTARALLAGLDRLAKFHGVTV